MASSKKKIFASLLLILIFGTGFYFLRPTAPKSTFTDREIVSMKIGDATLQKVEIVKTPASIQQGLSGRDMLGADGMLFVLDHEHVPTFWMKEMKFALDFVWIKDNHVVDMTEHVPAPAAQTPLNELKLYHPSQVVDMVLELPDGTIQQHTIQVGDAIIFH